MALHRETITATTSAIAIFAGGTAVEPAFSQEAPLSPLVAAECQRTIIGDDGDSLDGNPRIDSSLLRFAEATGTNGSKLVTVHLPLRRPETPLQPLSLTDVSDTTVGQSFASLCGQLTRDSIMVSLVQRQGDQTAKVVSPAVKVQGYEQEHAPTLMLPETENDTAIRTARYGVQYVAQSEASAFGLPPVSATYVEWLGPADVREPKPSTYANNWHPLSKRELAECNTDVSINPRKNGTEKRKGLAVTVSDGPSERSKRVAWNIGKDVEFGAPVVTSKFNGKTKIEQRRPDTLDRNGNGSLLLKTGTFRNIARITVNACR